ncbi:heavy metal-associated isoprenylated plant protein 36-like [Trifolium pratense]|uniref:heavy metal-associated isoprenylated plant protein 36-like n=1 Tax=Trifolium pratense TaxID=57577 RepID=UPI001E6933E0|nr:heavy metal-associated isoprenylated plant protein 36-like [Trifolium pratense]
MMSLKTSNKKMGRGFMCHSQSSTAVCMSTRESHVIVPKRIEKSVFQHDDTRLINFAKYSKLVESPMSNPVPKIVVRDNSVKNQKYQAIEPRELQKTPTDNVFQVVVMRVAIHCQGCAGKVKKHISKMEGVTSFTIDVDSKRVTVMGHISPMEVLESISKVKKAELWTTTPSC